jgi:uncharacterized damage-inducible protein DinB
MESIESFERLFAYDHWGNQTALASLSSLTGPPDKPLRYFSHVLAAQRLWRARFDNPSPPRPQTWPELTPEECRSAVEEIYPSWIALLQQLGAARLNQELVYRTTEGVEFQTPIRDVLTHVLMHSAYHRGQVAAAVRELGGKPAATDYVVYLRQQR